MSQSVTMRKASQCAWQRANYTIINSKVIVYLNLGASKSQTVTTKSPGGLPTFRDRRFTACLRRTMAPTGEELCSNVRKRFRAAGDNRPLIIRASGKTTPGIPSATSSISKVPSSFTIPMTSSVLSTFSPGARSGQGSMAIPSNHVALSQADHDDEVKTRGRNCSSYISLE